MRKWEDIVRDKLEEPGEALPESVFAEFHERLDAAPSRRRFPVVWALVPALAAGLAAVLFLRKPANPDDGIQVIQQPAAPVAMASDTIGMAAPVPVKMIVAQSVTPKPVHHAVPDNVVEPDVMENETPEPEKENTGRTMDQEAQGTAETKGTSPFIPEGPVAKSVSIKVAPAAGIVAGGGLVAALVSPLVGSGSMGDTPPVNSESNGANVTDPVNAKDVLTGHSHSLPFKGRISLGVPVADRLRITTGLEYSLYRSCFTYGISGRKKQLAHYLGVPVRLDWTWANSRWFDVYVGGGLEGDFCVGASLGGQKMARDGFAVSLLGAGGVQFNVTKRLGLYVEPELSWTIPSGNRVLATYRSENPLMFSVAAGIRINMCKQ